MYKSKNHSKYSLTAHIVFATKYRKKLFNNRLLAEELKAKLIVISDKSNFDIITLEVDIDHIHILIDYEPNISIVQIVRRLKQETHHHMWTIFETHLRRYYWYDKLFWSKGYFVCSIGKGSSYDTIIKYIDNQG